MAVRVVAAARAPAPPTVAPAAEASFIAPAGGAAAIADAAPTPTAGDSLRAGRHPAAQRRARRRLGGPGRGSRPTPTSHRRQRSLAAAPDYALGVTLNPGPRPLDEIEPEYPDIHLREGVVVLRLLIGATGHVDDVAVVRAAPEGVFEQAAVEAFARARFSPGLAGGTPVKSQITVEVQFVPINRGAANLGSNLLTAACRRRNLLRCGILRPRRQSRGTPWTKSTMGRWRPAAK